VGVFVGGIGLEDDSLILVGKVKFCFKDWFKNGFKERKGIKNARLKREKNGLKY